MRSLTERAARSLPHPAPVLELDVTKPEDFEALASQLSGHCDRIDGLVHAIAYAPLDALGGDFLSTPATSAKVAFETSAYSLKGLAAALLPLYPEAGASVVGLDFDASVAWPVYDWMGVSKAALEAVSRYLARDLGPRRVRVNLIAAGPLRTLALSGIPGIEGLTDAWSQRAPLGWDPHDPEPVAKAACFLLSDWSQGITGEILHVDGGFHAIGSEPVAEAGQPPTARLEALSESLG
jgi:enoyl-[acyl-carrier protein] reductase I